MPALEQARIALRRLSLGKWQDCEVEVEPLQCLGCSSVQVTSFEGIGSSHKAAKLSRQSARLLTLWSWVRAPRLVLVRFSLCEFGFDRIELVLRV